jgi:isocitrate dehydrogenase kinase/phosphatase
VPAFSASSISSPASLTDSRLAALCADAAQRAFADYESRFYEITRRARQRFLASDWAGSYADAGERLRLYSKVLDNLTDEVRALMGDRLTKRAIWMAIKAVYSSLIARSASWEIAESFFNSLTRRVFTTAGVDQAIEFVDTDFDAPATISAHELSRAYSGGRVDELLCRLLSDTSAGGFAEEEWADLRGSAKLAAERIETDLFGADSARSDVTLEVLSHVFYRGSGAYFVGRAMWKSDSTPLALCLRHTGKHGLELDAVLLGEVDLAILFSYTRAYFRVELVCPYELVRYLRQLMPRKRLVDLYNAIGFHRHGKTELYRDFVAHLRTSTDRFVPAEGARGMVMLVFTLPSYDLVFKLIKDRFDLPKQGDRNDVMRRYRLVFEHDRAGRLVEAHEFEHLRFSRDRFDPAVLEGLRKHAASTVRFEADDVLLGHVYLERRVQPLNVFFNQRDDRAAAATACDYAQAIKDLAASNIFPGDILTKNFGVTRHGRVVFYDYDELCFLIDCSFRDLPQPTTHEEEMAAEPWFSVRENDIFPEEFLQFLRFPDKARASLLEQHADLFTPSFWRRMQEKLRAGEIPEVFPYNAERRLMSGRGSQL